MILNVEKEKHKLTVTTVIPLYSERVGAGKSVHYIRTPYEKHLKNFIIK
jgi:hypothetical protein